MNIIYILFNNVHVLALLFIISLMSVHKVLIYTITKSSNDPFKENVTYKPDNICFIPIINLTQYAFVLFGYVLLHNVLEIIFNVSVLASFVQELVEILHYMMYTTLILIVFYAYIEQFSKCSGTWENYKTESAIQNMIYVISFVNVFICYGLFVILKYIDITDFENFEYQQGATSSTTTTLNVFVCLILTSILNLKKSQPSFDTSNGFIQKIIYTISFIFVLIFG